MAKYACGNEAESGDIIEIRDEYACISLPPWARVGTRFLVNRIHPSGDPAIKVDFLDGVEYVAPSGCFILLRRADKPDNSLEREVEKHPHLAIGHFVKHPSRPEGFEITGLYRQYAGDGRIRWVVADKDANGYFAEDCTACERHKTARQQEIENIISHAFLAGAGGEADPPLVEWPSIIRTSEQAAASEKRAIAAEKRATEAERCIGELRAVLAKFVP